MGADPSARSCVTGRPASAAEKDFQSSIRIDDWKSFSAALAGRPVTQERAEGSAPTADRNVRMVPAPVGLDLDYLAALLRARLAGVPGLEDTLVLAAGDTLVLSLPSSLLFPSGGAAIGERGHDALGRLGQTLGNIRNRIEVVGHTDSAPTKDGRYRSNWELSMARALAVAGALRRAGYRGDIPALGMADGRFRHLSASLPAKRRMELARRVDIVVRDRQGN